MRNIESETPVADAAERWLHQLAWEKRRERFTIAGALLGAAIGIGLVLAATQGISVEQRLILTTGLGGVSSLLGMSFANDPVGKWLVEKNYSFSLHSRVNFLSALRMNASKGFSNMNNS